MNHKKRAFHQRHLKQQERKRKLLIALEKETIRFLQYKIDKDISDILGLPFTEENPTTLTMESLLEARRKLEPQEFTFNHIWTEHPSINTEKKATRAEFEHQYMCDFLPDAE